MCQRRPFFPFFRFALCFHHRSKLVCLIIIISYRLCTVRAKKLLPFLIVWWQREKLLLPLKMATTILPTQERKIIVATFPKMGHFKWPKIRGYPLILGNYRKSGNNNFVKIFGKKREVGISYYRFFYVISHYSSHKITIIKCHSSWAYKISFRVFSLFRPNGHNYRKCGHFFLEKKGHNYKTSTIFARSNLRPFSALHFRYLHQFFQFLFAAIFAGLQALRGKVWKMYFISLKLFKIFFNFLENKFFVQTLLHGDVFLIVV